MYHVNDFLSVQFSGIKCIHAVAQPSPPSTSRWFSASPAENLNPLNASSPSSLPPAPGNCRSTSCPSEFDHSRCLVYGEAHSIRLFVAGLAQRPQGSSTLQHVRESPSSLKLNNIPLSVYCAFCFSIHSSTDIWAVPTFLAIVNNTAMNVGCT